MGRPRSGRPRFNKFRRFTFQFWVFFDTFKSDLKNVSQLKTRPYFTFLFYEPLIVPDQQIVEPDFFLHSRNSNKITLLTMKSKSPVIVEANARAKPAKDAVILGVTRHTNPVAPTIAADTRLNRTESHRLTGGDIRIRETSIDNSQMGTPPHIQ